MRVSLKKVFSVFINIVLHLIFLIALFYLLTPVFSWYLSKTPILGVDFFNSVTYVSYLQNNFSLPFSAFKDIWFGGYPLFRDFISFQYYPMIVFSRLFGIVYGIQLYVLVSLFLLGASSYFLYFRVSKSTTLSFLLALLVLYSVNIYGSAIWGGSLPYFTSQFFFPLILLMVYLYIRSLNKRYYYLGILITGIAFISHPLAVFAFMLPSALILLFFGLPNNTNTFFKNVLMRVSQTFIFAFLSLLAALPISHERLYFTIYSFIKNGPAAFFVFVKSTPSTVTENNVSSGPNQLEKYYQGLANLLYTDSNIFLFYLLGIGVILFIISLVLIRKKLVFTRVLPFILITVYIGMHTILNAYGWSIIPQGWYRAFWAFPVVISLLASSLFAEFFNLFRKLRISQVYFIVFSAVFLSIAYYFFSSNNYSNFTSLLDNKSEYSSAHPQAISIKTKEEERAKLKKELIPSFIDPSDKNKRLYEADALVNIWWNSFYDMPLARGYVDPPIASSQRGGLFWLDLGIANDSLIREFKIRESQAYNNTLFLIDWNAIYYFEGGREGLSVSAPPSSYLVENNVFDQKEELNAKGAILKYQTESGKPELHMEVPQYLSYYKIKDDLTSPVLSATNAPAILVFSDFAGYEDIMRVLAASNINSQYLIPARSDKPIDSLNISDLNNFNGIILHNYTYKNKQKAFKMLSQYVENGGKLFIDTGSEVKESEDKSLPDLFPFSSSKRSGIGTSWDLTMVKDTITENVDVDKFASPIFNNEEWKLSYPNAGSNLKEGAKVLIKNENTPLLVSFPIGRGEVVWSGFNLLYHINQYNRDSEIKLFNNIINWFAKIEKNQIVDSKSQWLKPEKVQLTANSAAKGVLFKEQGYQGWKARLKDTNKNLPIYYTGFTYPGYIYVPVSASAPFTIEFTYSAGLYESTVYILYFLILIFLTMEIITEGKFLGNNLSSFRILLSRRLKKWWSKEEDL